MYAFFKTRNKYEVPEVVLFLLGFLFERIIHIFFFKNQDFVTEFVFKIGNVLTRGADLLETPEEDLMARTRNVNKE